MTLEEAFAHAGRPTWADVEDRARQALPHYMFTDGKPRERTGYCTNCLNGDISLHDPYRAMRYTMEPYETGDGNDFLHHPETQWGLLAPATYYTQYPNEGKMYDGSGTHGHYGDCPICGARVQYRSFRMGRKTLEDRIFLIRYGRSAVEENAIVMTGWLVICKWGKWDEYNERLPELDTDLREICVFRPGEGGRRFTKHVWFYGETDGGNLYTLPMAEWKHPKKCNGGYNPYPEYFGVTKTRFVLDEDSVEDALTGTWMGALYRELKDSDILDRITLMNGLTRYPCIEYLQKLGFRTLAKRLALDDLDRRLVNVRGKTAPAVLRIDGNFYGWLRSREIDADPELLRTWHMAQKWKLRLGYDALRSMTGRVSAETLEKIAPRVGRERLEKTIRYILKKRLAAWEYIDHLRMMEELGMDTRDSAMIWPANFQELHTELAARVQIKADEAAARKLAARVDGLSGWWFSALGLTIRPFLTAQEVIDEGTAMKHCVGTYVDGYAAGSTVLLALREDERPGKPFRTVEYTTKGQLVQCRGYRNKSPEDEQPRIDEFFRLFDAYRAEYERLNGKKHKRAKAAA